MTLTFESPERDGCSIRVSFELRYDTCELHWETSPSATDPPYVVSADVPLLLELVLGDRRDDLLQREQTGVDELALGRPQLVRRRLFGAGQVDEALQEIEAGRNQRPVSLIGAFRTGTDQSARARRFALTLGIRRPTESAVIRAPGGGLATNNLVPALNDEPGGRERSVSSNQRSSGRSRKGGTHRKIE
jgi:hypothetical protein